MQIDLDAASLKQVQAILQEYVPDCEVWIFGSRVGGRAKPFSDLDLAIVSEHKIPVRCMALLANAFEESDLPFKVDLVDCQSALPAFRDKIGQRHEIIFQPTTR